ncbi:MAG: histidine phosphatase family protein [Actinobacteria bacterium]|nr:histidine phosphatase family protein [Actinomycetota bacterium]MBV8597399.1 histidine phosphatase family protein [Actinomycetota bacterium]
MRVVLIVLSRHGESAYSAVGLCNGDISVAVPLTQLGREEARRLGDALLDEPIELCVTSQFQRARETADIALAGRDVPRLVVPELNDPLVGCYEGAALTDYRTWAHASASSVAPADGGESRIAIVTRYARGFRLLLERPEKSILAVCHSLPVAYALAAREGREPTVNVPIVDHATPYPFTRDELDRATTLLEEWVAAPTW